MKTIETIAVGRIREKFQSDFRAQNLMDEHFVVVRQSDIVTQAARIGQPMRLPERRFLRILGGQAVYRINLIDHTLRPGDIVVLPPETIVEVVSLTDDYALEALAAIDFPGIDADLPRRVCPEDVLHLSLPEDDHRRMGRHLGLIALQMARPGHSDSALSLLVLSLFADATNSKRAAAGEPGRKLSRSEDIMSRFFALLRQHGTTQRNIPFYAARLALTPNHLSDVVRQQSGLSVMDWLHRTTLTEAKVLLRHSPLMIYEIAERLAFPEATAFNRYFKKHVGITPKAYREG